MIRFFALGILALILFSCDDESVAYNELKLNQSNAIHIFETKTSVSNELSITMDAILSDSRCPEGAICIWEGNAMVRYMLSRNNHCDTIILKHMEVMVFQSTQHFTASPSTYKMLHLIHIPTNQYIQ